MRTRYRKILVAAALSALASMAILASAATAATPAAPYQDFAGCPSRAESPFVGSCVKYTFSGGKIGLGNREIPVTNPIVLRGGFEQITGNFLYNAEGGIVPAKQTVPGGLIGLTGMSWLDEILGSKEGLKLYATVELAGSPSSVNELPFTVPVKVHLENPALGSGCYVGSATAPLTLRLTNGTTNPPAPNKPISGEVAGEFEPEAARPEVFTTATAGTLVDNAYAVPGASGCKLTVGPYNVSIDNLVDAAYKLPAAGGTNTTTLTYTASVVDPGVVYP
ncbi:MAG: hypothetical protein JST59_15195 [Actinobacteria bacterium]|nr:hypothetical protein [Actinomycetota bacterium]